MLDPERTTIAKLKEAYGLNEQEAVELLTRSRRMVSFRLKFGKRRIPQFGKTQSENVRGFTSYLLHHSRKPAS